MINIKASIKKWIAYFLRVVGPISKKINKDDHPKKFKVLVVGIVLSDRPNFFKHIVKAFGSREHQVTQYWVSLFKSLRCNLNNVTIENIAHGVPRNKLINHILKKVDYASFDYVIICDDDIKLPSKFLDDFLYIQDKLDFALAQPARTRLSYISHDITKRVPELIARETRFVEIGPLFCVHKETVAHILPLDETAEMGWGLDYLWPEIIQSLNKKMGIIDATPVDHSLRETANSYSKKVAENKMRDYLSDHDHITTEDANLVIKKHDAI